MLATHCHNLLLALLYKKEKNTKVQCMHTVNMIFIMHNNTKHLALMTVNYVNLAGI